MVQHVGARDARVLALTALVLLGVAMVTSDVLPQFRSGRTAARRSYTSRDAAYSNQASPASRDLQNNALNQTFRQQFPEIQYKIYNLLAVSHETW